MFQVTTLFHEIFNSLALLGLFILNVLIFNIPIQDVIFIGAASLSGSIVLGYFKREKSFSEQFTKTMCSAISAVFTGSAIVNYLNIERISNAATVYFVSGLLGLLIIQALVSVTEKNSKEIVIAILQKIVLSNSNKVERDIKKVSIKPNKENNQNGKT